ncbi:hypothetical protein AeMF1_006954 [Aphanomyces euteiches]|nr:hypothetical protein AeMF1_014344 [Aphanomyces euteiches]KAH9121223.1 hypothetical protein AeMF1_006954 [Aphanomyces euteiches]KAH9192555.1 hypothetical protein AeNC1_005473 [Aphanomyces euteiches]
MAGGDIFDAISDDDVEHLQMLLDSGSVDVNVVKKINKVAYTPLMLASEQGNVEMVRILLAREDINVNRPDGDTKRTPTPLIRASSKGHEEIVKLLIERDDVDVNATIEKNETAIQKAAFFGRASVVDLLWPVSDEPHKDRSLEVALNAKKFEVVALIIEKGREFPPVFQGKPLMCYVAPYLSLPSIVQMLVRDLPFEIVDHKIEPRADHKYTWTTFLDPCVQMDESVSKEAVVEALLEHKDCKSVGREVLIQHLLSSKDPHDRDALTIADTSMRSFLQGMLYFLNRYEIFHGPPCHVSATAVVVLAYDHGICNQVFEEYASNGSLDVDGFILCNEVLARLATDSNMFYEKAASERELWSKEFEKMEKTQQNLISGTEYQAFCANYFGAKFRVAIKFMRNEDEYEREIATRKSLDANFVLGLVPCPSQEKFQKHVRLLTINHELSMANYPHVVVMPSADRSLEDIFLKERPSENAVRYLLEEVVLALQHLHSHGIVHGDLKKLNILRVQSHLKLIDFDAATKFGQLIGTKFSSGILPPEMFCKLNSDAEKRLHESYWKSDDPAAYFKVKPKEDYVIKAYRQGSDCSSLPYTLVQATPTFDLWSLGCLMYQMWTGVELVSTDINQDVVDDRIETAATWTDEKLKQRIVAKVANSVAQDLLLKLLVVDPKKRQ